MVGRLKVNIFIHPLVAYLPLAHRVALAFMEVDIPMVIQDHIRTHMLIIQLSTTSQ